MGIRRGRENRRAGRAGNKTLQAGAADVEGGSSGTSLPRGSGSSSEADIAGLLLFMCTFLLWWNIGSFSGAYEIKNGYW
jgi:hypothetical protein